jgi:Family of unknown function (DUF5715)
MVAAMVAAALVTTLCEAPAADLRGSTNSMRRQWRTARKNDFTRLKTAADVLRFVRAGRLVRVRPTRSVELARVRFPYARPAVRTFVRRLGAQYRVACGEKLVVTSLTRPLALQPPNASRLSVHPAGMAVDLRRSHRKRCRAWLERTLLDLERAGLLEATREHHPPHYHVAVFPRVYRAYVARRVRDAPSSVANDHVAKR